jgi:hypothetical protein
MNKAKKDPDIWNQLLELKALTADTGTIHQAQIDQLSLWGWLAFPHTNSFDVAVGLPYLNKSETEAVEFYRIEYRVKATKRPPKNFKSLLEGLDRSIKSLLGNHFETVVTVNGTTIYHKRGTAKRHLTMRQRIERIQNDGGTSDTGDKRKGTKPRQGASRAR